MKLFYALKRFLISLINKLWIIGIYIHEYKNIFAKRKLWRKVQLTEAQKKEIDEYWLKHYGKKIPHWWHRLYMSYGGEFDARYFPEILFSTKIERKACPMFSGEMLSNKNLLDRLKLSIDGVEVYTPDTLARVIGGICYMDEKPIAMDDMLSKLYAEGGSVVVKIASGSSSGRGVKFFELSQISFEEFKETIINWHQPNLIFQDCIKPHPAFKKLNPSSINTVRVNSYVDIEKGEIAFMPSHMRIGRKGSRVDNAGQGGMIIGVSNDGLLTPRALGEWGKLYTSHPDSGFVFEGYRVPYVSKMMEAAKRLHSTFVGMEFISWDFCVDENDRIILIEVNLNSQTMWAPQMANGCCLFGDNTEYILRRLRNGWKNEV